MERGQQWKKALDLFACDLCACLERDVITYNSTINACAAWGAWSKAAQLFADLAGLRVEMNLITCNGALRSFSQGLAWRAALRCLEGMGTPDMVSYEAAINSCELCGELGSHQTLLGDVERRVLEAWLS